MMKKFFIMSIVILSVIFMAAIEVNAQENVYITPGKSVGKIELDMPVQQVIQLLGKPSNIFPSRNYKDIEHYIYNPRYKMNIAVKKDTGRVVEITVYAPHYKVINGLSVGSKKIRVEQEYGKKADVNNEGEYQFLFYRSAGINFGLKNGIVKIISVRGKNYSGSEIIYKKE